MTALVEVGGAAQLGGQVAKDGAGFAEAGGNGGDLEEDGEAFGRVGHGGWASW